MSATLLYRIASILLLLFAVGHTYGFVNFKPDSPDGAAVLDAMKSVQFTFKGGQYSYGNFYLGFGLTVTVYLLFSAFLAWHLGALAASQPDAIGMLGWAFVLVQIACLILSVQYFFIAPAIFSGIVVVLLGWATWLVQHL